jgi:hypothetical protein
VTVLARVLALLHDQQIRVALIGAAALAAHGASRATLDIDVLTTDRRVLDRRLWEALAVPVEVRSGDADDPLAGIARIRPPGERHIDVIVGRYAWQQRLVDEAQPGQLADVTVPIVDPCGLILLKLYAGGPQDAWDIAQLLAAGERDGVIQAVDRGVGELPGSAQELWARIRPRVA